MMIINLIGLLLIALIVWWFWLYNPDKAVDTNTKKITIIVDNGIYQPSRIKVEAGKKVSLQFLRKDGGPCAATVIFPEFEISEELPLDTTRVIDLPVMPSGEYSFHCPMKMYIGTLIVE